MRLSVAALASALRDRVLPTAYHRVPKLIAGLKSGVVRSFFLPVGAQGE